MSGDIIDMDESGNVQPERPGPHRFQPGHHIGRPKGSTSKERKLFQDFVNSFLERRQDELEEWILEVARGKPTQVIDPQFDAQGRVTTPGGVIAGTDPNPAKAVELVLKMAEFGAPKQTRVVQAGDPDAPPPAPVLNVTIGGKRIDVTQGSTMPKDDA